MRGNAARDPSFATQGCHSVSNRKGREPLISRRPGRLQHTPGPWKQWTAYGETRFGPGEPPSGDTVSVGVIFGADGNSQSRPIADAHLCVAAPEMLNALRGLLNAFGGRYEETSYEAEVVKEGWRVVERAEGREEAAKTGAGK